VTRPSLAPGPDSDTLDPPGGLDRLRVLAAAAMGTVLLSYAMFVPVATVIVRSGGRDIALDGAFAAAVPLWLAAHQVPLVIQGQPLSVLPLLPTLVVVLIIAYGCGWAINRLGGRARSDGGAVLATAVGTHATVAVLGSALLPPEIEARPWSAMLAAGAVAALGSVVGTARTSRAELRALLLRWPARPGWVMPALHGAAVGVTGLLAVGAGLLVVGLTLGSVDVAAAYGRLAPDATAGVGVTLLACAYLPNAVIAAASWALGPGVGVGPASASPVAAIGPVDPSSFPLLAALPTGAPPVALVALALPVGIGVLVGRSATRACPPSAPASLRTCASAAASVGTAGVCGLLGWLAGGRLATGGYDPVQIPAGLVVLAVLLWVGVPGALVTLTGRRPASDAVHAARARRAEALRAAGGDPAERPVGLQAAGGDPAEPPAPSDSATEPVDSPSLAGDAVPRSERGADAAQRCAGPAAAAVEGSASDPGAPPDDGPRGLANEADRSATGKRGAAPAENRSAPGEDGMATAENGSAPGEDGVATAENGSAAGGTEAGVDPVRAGARPDGDRPTGAAAPDASRRTARRWGLPGRRDVRRRSHAARMASPDPKPPLVSAPHRPVTVADLVAQRAQEAVQRDTTDRHPSDRRSSDDSGTQHAAGPEDTADT